MATVQQYKVLEFFDRANINVTGKKVLEIGGGSHLRIPRIFEAEGASEVLVTNISHGIVDAQVSEVIKTKKHSALDLASLGQKFDVIYGINVLEHIPKPAALISAIQQALTPGGYVFLSGGPLWTSMRGHHVWIDVDDRSFKFTDNEILGVIEPWEHIIYREKELSSILLERVGDLAARAIVRWVYHSEQINRCSHAEIVNALKGSELLVEELVERKFINPKYQNNFEASKATLSDGSDPAVMGLDVLLRKSIL